MSKIFYGDNLLAVLAESEKKATLKCAGCQMEADVVVEEDFDTTPIVEVDELPEVGLDGVVYKVNEFTGVAVYLENEIYDDIMSYIGEPAQYYVVSAKPVENIEETSEENGWNVYYVKDENDIFYYAEGEWHRCDIEGLYFMRAITNVNQATTQGYYAVFGRYHYAKYVDECYDVVGYDDEELVSLSEVLTKQGIRFISVRTRPQNPALGYYYIRDEKMLAYYDGEGWQDAELTNIIEINDISEITSTEEDKYYALITTWQTYDMTQNALKITARGTYDITNYKKVLIDNVDIIDTKELLINPNNILDKFYRKDGELYKWNSEKVVADTDSILGTWYLNEAPELITGEYNINFYSGIYTYYDSPFDKYTKIQIGSEYINYYQPNMAMYAPNLYSLENSWSKEEYRTITIYGGNDIANETFITWLKANAVRKGAWVKYVPES